MEQDSLNYNFGTLYPITQGEWEISLKSLAISYKKKSSTDPDPPNINTFLRLTCNYVESLSLSDTVSVSTESVLSIIHLKLKLGQNAFFNFSERDFFYVSSPKQKFQFKILKVDGTTLPDSLKKNLQFHVLVLFRRIS